MERGPALLLDDAGPQPDPVFHSNGAYARQV